MYTHINRHQVMQVQMNDPVREGEKELHCISRVR